MALTRKIACVHLDSGETDVQPIPADWRHRFIGGRGLGAYLLFKQTSAGCDPLGPDNAIIFSSGLLGGTLTAPFECTQVATKSPLTRLMGRASLSGFFASELRWAGFDHLVVKGRARRPVYLWIHNGHVQLRDAGKIWGRGVFESRDLIRKELGDENVRIVCIGPAGENRVRYANVTADRGQIAGRTGLGAVLGSKRVKAVVCRGEMDIQIKQPEAALKLQKEFLDTALTAKPGLAGPELARQVEATDSNGCPAEYGQQTDDRFYPDTRLLADLGLDPLAAETMVRWAGALYENRVITDKDTAGVYLSPGNPDTLRQLITQIALREGLGDALARGPLQAARMIGNESLKYFRPHARLIDLYREVPFDAVSHALNLQALPRSNRTGQPRAVDDAPRPPKDDERSAAAGRRTASHLKAGQMGFAGSAGTVLWQELFEIASNCLGICMEQISPERADLENFTRFKELIALNTGLTIGEAAIRDCAYRCFAIERLYNLRESLTTEIKQGREFEFELPAGLRVPEKLLNNFDIKMFRRLVADHHRLNGWDKAAVLKLKIFKALELNDLWPLVKPKGGS